MCLLTFMQPDSDIPYKHAKEAAKNNPHGFGFAIHTGDSVLIDKDMDFEKLWARWTLVRATNRGPALMHFRIATHGTQDINNCHPFVIGDNPKNVLAHNGILPLTMPINSIDSDTKIFAETILPYCGISSLDDTTFFEKLEEWALGSKLVILSADAENKYLWYIINEPSGTWSEGVWYSNTSHKPYTYTYQSTYSSPYAQKYNTKSVWTDDSFYDEEDRYYKENNTQLALDYDSELDNPDNTDLGQYLTNVLYPDDKTFGTIRIFTEYCGDKIAIVTCYNCGQTFMVDPYEVSATDCGECSACLACAELPEIGHTSTCGCWKEYEYERSYLNAPTLPIIKAD